MVVTEDFELNGKKRSRVRHRFESYKFSLLNGFVEKQVFSEKL